VCSDIEAVVAQRFRYLLEQQIQVVVEERIADRRQRSFQVRLTGALRIANQQLDGRPQPSSQCCCLGNRRLISYQRIDDDQDVGNSIHVMFSKDWSTITPSLGMIRRTAPTQPR
jgi:hypothetical protein